MEKIRLNDGNEIPAIGFGVFLIPNDGSCYKAVREALDKGRGRHDPEAPGVGENLLKNYKVH